MCLLRILHASTGSGSEESKPFMSRKSLIIYTKPEPAERASGNLAAIDITISPPSTSPPCSDAVTTTGRRPRLLSCSNSNTPPCRRQERRRRRRKRGEEPLPVPGAAAALWATAAKQIECGEGRSKQQQHTAMPTIRKKEKKKEERGGAPLCPRRRRRLVGRRRCHLLRSRRTLPLLPSSAIRTSLSPSRLNLGALHHRSRL